MLDRHFLVLFERFPIEEAQVRSGENTPEVIVASRCVNVALFISGNLRRNVSLTIAWGAQEDLQAITFPGDTLKRVSPDERSISFFLLKSKHETGNLLAGGRKTLDNGIKVKRTDLDTLLNDWSPLMVFAAVDSSNDSQETPAETTGVFMYGLGKHQIPKIQTYYVGLPRPTSPERFILDINMKSDR